MSDDNLDDATERKRAPDEFSADPLSGKIGKMLRKSYQEVVDEGIPDDFMELLRTADKNKGS